MTMCGTIDVKPEQATAKPKYRAQLGSFGPSNDDDTPYEELVLAQLVQSAKARGLRAVNGPKYLARDGRKLTPTINRADENLSHTCAIGAYDLDAATWVGKRPDRGAVVSGHERTDNQVGYEDSPSFQAGAAFNDAMGGKLQR